ncbi:MAG: RNA polymerase sigma factor [Myxococcota bacterium]|nr:RNA polymerase sigma factor [Myxococcota bacterium]
MGRQAKPVVDTSIVEAAQAGDSRALEKLIGAHYPAMCRLALRYTNDPDLAKDAVQDACIQVMRYFPQLRDTSSFKSWMSRIVINCVRLHQRRNKRFVAFGDGIERTQEVCQQQPDEVVMTREELVIVDDFLKSAQNDERAIFLQLYVGGDAVATVSEKTGISVAALKTRVHRARRRLKKYMHTKHDTDLGFGQMGL